MATFLSASDESASRDGKGLFFHGGLIGPIPDWEEFFAPAWQERVLGLNPNLPYLHMVDIRRASWRERVGISYHEAERRTDEAVNVIASCGMSIVTSELNEPLFRSLFRHKRMLRSTVGQFATDRFEPDHLAFLGYVHAVLRHVRDERPDCDRVDFLVEEKAGITHLVERFERDTRDFLNSFNDEGLGELLGCCRPVPKARIPVQAADVVCWHLQRGSLGLMDSCDTRRFFALRDYRSRSHHQWTDEYLERFAVRLDKQAAANPVDVPAKKRKRH